MQKHLSWYPLLVLLLVLRIPISYNLCMTGAAVAGVCFFSTTMDLPMRTDFSR